MHHLSMQGHHLDHRDQYYQQSQYQQQNHTTASNVSSNKVFSQPQTISATLDRRTIGNSTVSPPVFSRQKSFDSATSFKRKDHNFETTDLIESYPHRHSSTLSSRPQDLCRVSNLNTPLCDSSSGVLHVDSGRPLPVLPSSAQLDATVTCLWILTPLAATVSAVIILVAITTNQWLHTEENMINPSYNGSGERDQLSKFTVSGLWKLCYTARGRNFQCSKIDYFPKEEYLPDPNDSTMAIPYAVTKSSVFIFLAAAILIIGYFCCLIGHCARHRRIYTFTSGVLFIISGLLMLIGLVMYISVFKAEVGSKLRHPSFASAPTFNYRYGYSFILYVSGFLAIEMAGTSAVFLFIYWHQKDWLMKLTEKYSSGSDSNISYTNLEQGSVFPCKKHPQAYTIPRSQPIGASYEPSTSGISPSKQQRKFVFDQEALSAVSPSCSYHKNKKVYVSSSLRDVSSLSRYKFTPPPQLSEVTFGEPYTIDYPEIQRTSNSAPYGPSDPTYLTGGGSTRSLHLVGSNIMPRDATTNTISTTVDIVTPNEDFSFMEGASGQILETFSPGAPRDFISFDLERSLELKPAASVAIGNQTLKKDFSGGTETLRRTTPV